MSSDLGVGYVVGKHVAGAQEAASTTAPLPRFGPGTIVPTPITPRPLTALERADDLRKFALHVAIIGAGSVGWANGVSCVEKAREFHKFLNSQ